MPLVIDDRVRETTTVTGLNDATLLGAVTGFQAFSVIGNGNTTYYTISDQSGGNWEVGLGTFSSVGPTLARTTVLSSSAGGAKVSFPAGTKDVFVTYPSEKAVYLDGSNNAQPALGNVVASQVNITAQGDLRLEDTTGGQYVAIHAPGTVASSYTLTLPVDDGTNGQALITDGSGNLSWSSAASGDVYGPASATDNAISRFDGTTGKIIQNSSALIDDAGNVLAGAGLVGAPAFSTTGDTNTGIFFPAADTIAFTEGGVESMRINSSAQVGINTTSPAFPLDIQCDTSAFGLRLRGRSDDISVLRFVNNAANATLGQFDVRSTAFFINAVANMPMIFSNNNTERMRIQETTGNVGIGLSNPAVRADINGVMRAATWSLSGTGVAGGTTAFSAGTVSTDTNWGMYFRAPTGSAAVAEYSFRNAADTERMRIDSQGNVGIGISSPTAKLDVVASSGTLFRCVYSNVAQLNIGNGGASINYYDADTQIYRSGNGTERMRIDSSGNVGIGVSNPAQKLQVVGNILNYSASAGQTVIDMGQGRALDYCQVRAFSSPQASAGYTIFGFSAFSNLTGTNTLVGNAEWTKEGSGTDNKSYYSIQTHNGTSMGERMRIDSSGNVGIGTSSPLQTASGRVAVTVNGSSSSIVNLGVGGTATGLYYADATAVAMGASANIPLILQTNATERMRIDSSGNVGIGTSSGSFRLSVVDGSSATRIYVQNSANAAGGAGIYLQTLNAGSVVSNATLRTDNAGNFSIFSGTTTEPERMRIDGSGNVGIGTSSPAARLDVSGGSIRVNEDGVGTKVIQIRSNWAGVDPAINVQTNNPLLLNTNGIERMRIESGGNVKIGNGAASASARLMVNVTSGSAAGIQLFQDGVESWIISNPASSTALTFANSGTERMRIDSSGNLLVGKTSNVVTTAGVNIYPSGDVYSVAAGSTDFDNMRFYRNGSATAVGRITTTSTATSYVTSSDYRLKENIAPMTGALNRISLLKPCTYTWKANGSSGEGFIAHELAEVVPDCVTGEKDAVDEDGNIKPQGIDTSFLVATLTAAIQEQQTLINNLTTRLNALEGK